MYHLQQKTKILQHDHHQRYNRKLNLHQTNVVYEFTYPLAECLSNNNNNSKQHIHWLHAYYIIAPMNVTFNE